MKRYIKSSTSSKDFTKYYCGWGDIGVMSQANMYGGFDTLEEAVEDARYFKKEILHGVYDEEYGIDANERQALADDIFVYSIRWSSSGAQKSHKFYDF